MLQAGAIVLAGMAMAFPGSTLTHAPTSDPARLLEGHRDLSRLQLYIVYASLESRMQWQIVWQRIEIGYLVTAEIQNRQHIHPTATSGRSTRNIELSIHREPGLSSNPAHLNLVRNPGSIQPEINGFLCEYATGPGSQIPGEHYVALDEAHRQVIALLVVITRLPEEGQQRNLRHGLRQDFEAQLERILEGNRHRVGHKRGESIDAAGEGWQGHFKI